MPGRHAVAIKYDASRGAGRNQLLRNSPQHLAGLDQLGMPGAAVAGTVLVDRHCQSRRHDDTLHRHLAQTINNAGAAIINNCRYCQRRRRTSRARAPLSG